MMSRTSIFLLFGGGIVVGLFLPILLRFIDFQFFADRAEATYKRLNGLVNAVGRFFKNQDGYRGAKVENSQQMDSREQQLIDSAHEIRTILLSLTDLLQRADQAASHSTSTLGDVRITIDDLKLTHDLRKVHILLIQEIDRMISNNTTLKKELARSQDRLAEQRNQIETLKTAIRVDGLTQLANRMYFDEKLREMVSLQNRYPDPFSLLMIDVDEFKRINDSLGHQAGDRFLRRIAGKLKASIRESDFIARFGGDEFALILPKTKAASAGELGRKICRLMEESLFLLDGKGFTVTLSIGIAEVILGETSEAMINRADGALYQAKQEGRNRTIIAATPLEKTGGPVKISRRE
jgi:diguanylate cyclase